MQKTLLTTVFSVLILAGCSKSDDSMVAGVEAESGPKPVTAADYIFTNGKVYTVNEEQPWAEAVVIRGKEIVFVGDNAAAVAFVGESTNQIDLDGKMLLPGFVDNHIHPTAGALIANGTQKPPAYFA